MRRALTLAAHGREGASPNPMVGCVICSADGRIIGEGWHRRCGQGHAEVNAVASIADADLGLIPDATVYVTLEPCSHWGKTPPCAKMLIERGFRHIVVATVDPFAKVSGRGISMLREAGAEVITGVLEDEARRLNAKFFTAHTSQRPWITLKWARSADGFIDHRRNEGEAAAHFSTPMSAVAVHRLRASHDAIAVGPATLHADRPRLNLRLWPGRDPKRLVVSERPGFQAEGFDIIDLSQQSLADAMHCLYQQGITSLLVEGGTHTLQLFIDSGLWDMAREEVAPWELGERGSVRAPILDAEPSDCELFDQNMVYYYSNNALADVKNL